MFRKRFDEAEDEAKARRAADEKAKREAREAEEAKVAAEQEEKIFKLQHKRVRWKLKAQNCPAGLN